MKKALSLFLVCLLILSLFAGCADDSAQKGKADSLTAMSSTVPQSSEQPQSEEEKPVHMLDGKKIIFIGNSYTYYGKTVLEKNQTVLTQDRRNNDHGYFYQLCKQNGAEVSVTNWTFGAHDFTCLFEKCTANRGCDGVDHASYLVDRNYDYVVMQQGNASANIPDFIDKCDMVMNIFKEANPNVKFVFLVQSQAHINSYAWLPELDTLRQKGVTVVDWGALVYDIMNGAVAVPGGSQTYNKNSFIVCKSAADGYHPNMLSGYITTLMTYCAITGESAVGQSYDYCNDTSINGAFNFDHFCETYYCYDNATTNFPDVFASPADMKGIQTLADQYLKTN